MSETNVRRSIQKPTTFDAAWIDGEQWFTEPEEPALDFHQLHAILEHLFPDAMRQARDEGQI